MDVITCSVVDARDGRPVVGVQVILKVVTKNFEMKEKFRGCTSFDGEVH